QFDIGAEYHLNTPSYDVSVQADVYENRIDNRIVCLPLKGTYTWSMMNYGKTFCRGLNSTASFRYRTGAWQFSVLASLTWQDDLNRTDPDDEETYNKPICYSPSVSYGLTGIVAWKNLSLTVSDLHVGERMWSYADSEDILSPYNNIDMKLSGSWCNVGASLEINDLLDVQYEHIPRYPMPGRSFRFSLTYSL
nr:TonB-dependent receptor [Bacteroidaceae bacterium]